MSLADSFKKAQDKLTAENKTPAKLDPTLMGMAVTIAQYAGHVTVYQTYNFLTRMLICNTTETKGGVTVVPFAQLDREVLEFMHAELVKLGGNPPPLPAIEGNRSLISKNTP